MKVKPFDAAFCPACLTSTELSSIVQTANAASALPISSVDWAFHVAYRAQQSASAGYRIARLIITQFSALLTWVNSLGANGMVMPNSGRLYDSTVAPSG